MHKNKKRLLKEKHSSKPRQIIEWAVVIIVGLTIGAFVANWINNQSFAQLRYANPNDMSFQSGIPMLVGYCIGLVVMMICGYLFARRIDYGLPKGTQITYKHKKMA